MSRLFLAVSAVLLGAAPALADEPAPKPVHAELCAAGQLGGGLCGGEDDELPNGVSVARGAPTVGARYGKGVYVEQIGQRNRATITQRSPGGAAQAYARLVQQGDDNGAVLEQSGQAFAEWVQVGDGNTAEAVQGGAGHKTLVAIQQGHGNSATVRQSAYAFNQGAHLTQTGDGNTLSLSQSGDDNHATLSQNGDGNSMTVSQSGGAKLAWSQDGDNLADLGISQTGAQALTIHQSNP